MKRFTIAMLNSVCRDTLNLKFWIRIIFTNVHIVIKNAELREESNLSNCLNCWMWFFKDSILTLWLAPETNSMINVLFLMSSISTTILMVISKFLTNWTKILLNIFWNRTGHPLPRRLFGNLPLQLRKLSQKQVKQPLSLRLQAKSIPRLLLISNLSCRKWGSKNLNRILLRTKILSMLMGQPLLPLLKNLLSKVRRRLKKM